MRDETRYEKSIAKSPGSDPSNFDDRFRATTLSASKEKCQGQCQYGYRTGCTCSPLGGTCNGGFTFSNEIFHGGLEVISTDVLVHRLPFGMRRLAGPLTTRHAAIAIRHSAVITTIK